MPSNEMYRAFHYDQLSETEKGEARAWFNDGRADETETVETIRRLAAGVPTAKRDRRAAN